MAVAAPEPPAQPEQFVLIPARVWKLMLVVGAVVWIIAAVIPEVTDDDILVPTVIIVGSFMSPSRWRRSRSHASARAT